MQNQLTTLSNAGAWLDITTVDDDALLRRLIGAASNTIHAYLQRPTIFQHVYSELYDGAGRDRQMLRQWPVVSVGSLNVGNQAVPAAASYGQPGYTLEPWDGLPPGGPQSLTLSGYGFCRGSNNVAVTYTAGYVVRNEPQIIPSSGTYSVNVSAPYGNWGADSGVTFANGTPLTQVAAAPAVGQYAAAKGTYTFATADAGKSVLVSYSYIPADIEQACIELVGERYRSKERIGQTSKSLGGQETVAFSTKSMNDFVREMLHPYMRVVPC